MQILHPVAFHFDDQGRSYPIHAKDLNDPTVLERAKLTELFDESHQVTVSPRFSVNGTPHFYAKSTGKRGFFRSKDNDPAHDSRVNQLCQSLQELGPWSLTMVRNEKKGNEKAMAYADAFKRLPEYSWGTEVSRILSSEVIVRHDIFGQPSELSMSIRQPWVAIEVVNTHFPEEAAFSAMLTASAQFPLIILFELTAYRNYFVAVNHSRKSLQYSNWTYLIQDGAVWQNGARTNITTSARLKIEVDGMLSRWAKYRNSSKS